jgi:hypothetical protein
LEVVPSYKTGGGGVAVWSASGCSRLIGPAVAAESFTLRVRDEEPVGELSPAGS